MKNNILLITVVSIIAIAVISLVLIANTGKLSEESSSTNSTTTALSETLPSEPEKLPEDKPQTTIATTAPAPPETVQAETEQPSYEAEGIIATANSLLGVEFMDNGDTPAGFDNSGFIYYVLRENGYITCPRVVTKQAAMGTAITYEELKAGDLVFFYNEDNSDAGFGGIYIGNGNMIACLMPGTAVKVIDISTGYYRDSFYKGVSLS